LLNRAKADLNEQVNITRSAGGSLRVEGVVDNQERKKEFLRALAPVLNNPAVKIDIRTVAEATQRPSSGGTVIIQEPEKTAETIAAYEDLRDYFIKRDPSGPTEEAIRNYSSRVVNGSHKALFHAIELKRLVDRFANFDMRTIAPDARTKWLGMLHEEANNFAQKTEMLRQELQPVFLAGKTISAEESTSIQNDVELARAVERLHRIALSTDQAISAAFTISSQSSATVVKSTNFWQSLQRAENLATAIRRYQRTTD
jgi:hypothetical protein